MTTTRSSTASGSTGRWQSSPVPRPGWVSRSPEALAEAGADVVLTARRTDRLKQTRALVEELGPARANGDRGRRTFPRTHKRWSTRR